MPKIDINQDLFKHIHVDPAILQAILKVICHPSWETDYNHALAEAKSKNFQVLAAFTSKTCPHCIALKKEVFDTCAFGFWRLQSKLVLLEIEAPPVNTPLMQKYSITGYPTVLGLCFDGSECGRVVGYTSGSGFADWKQRFENSTQACTVC